MRALVVERLGELALRECAAPAPAPGAALIDIGSAGINFPDLMMIDGTYQYRLPLPFIPGKECAGIVRAVGEGVTALRPGDRVVAQIEYGAYAEQVVVPAVHCHQIPDQMSLPDAAAMGLAHMTAHFALVERAAMKPGESVLVTGAAGGIGLAAVQVAKALGATVLAAVSTPQKAAAAREGGADYIIDTSAPGLRDALREQVHAAVGRRGVDVVVENVGGEVFEASLRALAWCGRLVVVGFAGGRIPEVKAGHILVKNISVIGLQVSDYRDRDPAKWLQVRRQLFELYAAEKIRPRIMATFPLERYREALAIVRSRAAIGKVMFDLRPA